MYVHWTRVFDGAGRVEAIEETLQVARQSADPKGELAHHAARRERLVARA